MGVCGAKQKDPNKKNQKSIQSNVKMASEKSKSEQPKGENNTIFHTAEENGKKRIPDKKEIAEKNIRNDTSVEPNENLDEKRDDQNNFDTLKRKMFEDVYELHLNAIEEALQKKNIEGITYKDTEPEKRGDYYVVVSTGGYNI